MIHPSYEQLSSKTLNFSFPFKDSCLFDDDTIYMTSHICINSYDILSLYNGRAIIRGNIQNREQFREIGSSQQRCIQKLTLAFMKQKRSVIMLVQFISQLNRSFQHDNYIIQQHRSSTIIIIAVSIKMECVEGILQWAGRVARMEMVAQSLIDYNVIAYLQLLLIKQQMGQTCSFPQRNQTTEIVVMDNPIYLQDTESTNTNNKTNTPLHHHQYKYHKTFKFPQPNQKIKTILAKIKINPEQHERLLSRQSFVKDKVHYQSTLQADEMDGYSRVLFPDGAYFEGMLVGSQIQGQGVLIGGQLDYYIGQFKNNKAEGKGLYHCKSYHYEGQFKNNMMEGYGKLTTQDTVFTGKIIKGEKVKGKYIKFKENLIYEGQFRKQQFNGSGRLEKDSEIYDGYFQNGKMKGKGKYIMRNGNYYVGLFQRSLANGYGTLYNRDNLQLQSGLWRDNKFIKK